MATTKAVLAAAEAWVSEHPGHGAVVALLGLARSQGGQVAALSRKVAGLKEPVTGVSSSKVHANQRRALRKQLESDTACDPELIDAAVEQLRWRQLVERHGERVAAEMAYASQPDQPDDSRFRPSPVPPELRGAGRAVGESARAVRAGKTVTKWQHDERSSDDG